MTDLFVLLQLPNAGDDLQAIKKGVMELADLVVINKADLDEDAATRARAQITSALRILGLHRRPREAERVEPWQPQVMQLSALKAHGVAEFWSLVLKHQALQAARGEFFAHRLRQEQAWMWERIDIGLKAAFRTHPGVAVRLLPLSRAVGAGEVAASVAARELLHIFSPTLQA
jgi:LAO/AO transport system kinase